MKTLCRALAVTAALVAGAFSAQAADIYNPQVSSNAVTYAAPSDDWTGGYVGVLLGYSWADFDGHAHADFFAEHPGGTFLLPLAYGNFGDGVDGFSGGAQVGYDKQIGNAVVGVVADWSWQDVDGSSFTEQNNGFISLIAPNNAIGLSSEFGISNFGTLRARAGILAHDYVLLYLTGGLAIGSVDVAAAVTNNGEVVEEFGIYNKDEIMVGWTAGAGIEAKLNANWRLKAEYLYMDFGDQSFDLTAANEAETFGIDVDGDVDITQHVLRAGIAYQF